jgi:hypothetical protein
MTEKVLPYDHDIVPQEKPWDCGPASAQVVLNSRNIIRTEDDLIQEIGTTVKRYGLRGPHRARPRPDRP